MSEPYRDTPAAARPGASPGASGRNNDRAARLAAAVKESAQRLGFTLAGIAPAEPPPHHQHLQTWLAAGHAGEMSYLARDPEKRSDPRRLLEGARSVVVVAAPYAPPASEVVVGVDPGGISQEMVSAGGGVERTAAVAGASAVIGSAGSGPPRTALAGTISAYGRGEDYHHLMGERLQSLAAEMTTLTGAETRFWCDTGPLLERPLAARAGLGWVGKNTLLINRDLGSWLFLGVVITRAALKPDLAREAPGYCGRCERCLEACPTGALIAPYELDARRCISYLTIELKGSIPRELRPSLGNRLFGCDDCQSACPWNQRLCRSATRPPTLHPPAPGSVQTTHGGAAPLFLPSADLTSLDPARCLFMSEAEFQRRLAATPISRARRRGLRRNAAVVLGNAGGPPAVDPLARALADEDALLREHAAWALGEIGRRHAGDTASLCRARLSEALARETDPTVRRELEAGM